MTPTREIVLQALETLTLPDGRTLVSADLIRALNINEGAVSFVIEADTSESAAKLQPMRAAAEAIVAKLPGVTKSQVMLTAHAPAAKAPAKPATQGEPPSLKIGGHPKQQQGKTKPSGVARILAIG